MKHNKLMNTVTFVLIVLVVLLASGCGQSAAPETLPEQPQSPSSSPTEEESVDAYRIVIDAGHGGIDPGATGASGAYEKDYNLSLALKLYELLEQDPMFEPLLTRDEDQLIDLKQRAGMANEWNADAFISIHGNTFEDPDVSGTETLYYSKNSKALARVIQNHVAKALNTRNRGIKKQEFTVLKEADMPSIIVEAGYLTNPEEEKLIISPEGQDLAANAIYEGLKQYFNLE